MVRDRYPGYLYFFYGSGDLCKVFIVFIDLKVSGWCWEGGDVRAQVSSSSVSGTGGVGASIVLLLLCNVYVFPT